MPDAPSPIDPTTTALLVMDLQPGILGRLDDADALVERTAAAIATARERGAHVGYVRVAFTDADSDAVPPTSRFAPIVASGREAFHADAPGTQVDERVAPREGDITVRKTRVGAFSTTDLDDRLRARGVTHLVLSGVSTSGVVLSTVRDASDRDYGLFVLRDLCADPDEVAHEVLLDRVFPGSGGVLRSDGLAALLGG